MSTSGIKAIDDPNKDDVHPGAGKITPINADLLRGMRITLEVRLGRSEIAVEELMALKAGAVVPLDTTLSDNLDIYLNDVLVARGTVVAVGDKFGVRIVEVSAT